MCCDVKMHFSQFLKARFDGRHFGDFIYLTKKCLPVKKINILEYWIEWGEGTFVRILQHNFEQFSCIQKQKIYDEIFGWFVWAVPYA